MAIILIDIDYFKEYNDTYGHQAGDELLKKVGTILKGVSQAQKHAIGYRVGGDEFAMQLFDKSEEQIEKVAQTILEKMRSLRITHEKNPYGIATLSIGAGILRGFDSKMDKIYKCADNALYRAKTVGRNTVVVEECLPD